jgi:hypothetical protein
MDIELTEEQRRELGAGSPVRVVLDDQPIVLLHESMYERIKATQKVERAIIEAGHARAFVALPEPLEATGVGRPNGNGLENIVVLRGDKYEEIAELVQDARDSDAIAAVALKNAARRLQDEPW